MNAILELQNKQQEFQRKADALKLAIEILSDSGSLENNGNPLKGIDVGMRLPLKSDDTWRRGTVLQRVIGIIKVNGKFMFRKDIEAFAEQNGKPFTGHIASTMSGAPEDSELIMINDNGNKVWGLKSWTQDGQIVLEYMYK